MTKFDEFKEVYRETGGYFKPHQQMFEDLRAFSGKPLFCSQAIKLKVVLDLGRHSALKEKDR